MKIVFSKDFVKSAKILPASIKKKLSVLLDALKKNPFDEKLHTKPLMGSLKGNYSFRITRDWRVIFVFLDNQTISLVDAAHRKDIYR